MKELIPRNSELKKSELSFEKFCGIWPDGFENIRACNGKSGKIVLGTDKCLRKENQDVLAVDFENNAFCVIDGMGGYKHAKEIAKIIAEQFQKAVKNGICPQEMQNNAFNDIKKAGFQEGGAVYFAGQIEKKKLKVWYAGDAHLVVCNRKGEIKYSSEYTPMTLANIVNSKGPGKTETYSVLLENYDRIVVGTDGLFNNFKEEDLKEMAGLPALEAIKKIIESAKYVMKNGFDQNSFGNPDNLTILIYDILPIRGK